MPATREFLLGKLLDFWCGVGVIRGNIQRGRSYVQRDIIKIMSLCAATVKV